MVLFRVLVLALFTFVVIRLFAAKSTVSERTMGAYLLLGSLYGLLVVPLLARIVSPYGEMGSWIAFFHAMAVHIALLWPISYAVFRTRAFRALSVADAFVVAFMLGFGCDLAGLVMASFTAAEPIQGYTIFPPFQLRAVADGPVVPGHGYWIALIAMGIAAATRFIRKPWAPWAVGAPLIALTAFEAGALRVAPQGIWETLFKLTRQGGLTAWVVLLGVAGLSILEAGWEAKKAGPTEKFSLIEEWQALLSALVRGRLREFQKVARERRTRRQARIMAAECDSEPTNEALCAGAKVLASASPSEDFGRAPSYGGTRLRPSMLSVWGGWVGLAIALFLLPKLPEGIRDWSWSFWGLHYPIPGLPFTILSVVLAVILVRRIIGKAGLPEGKSNADDIVAFIAERGLFLAAFGVLLIVFVYQHPERFLNPAPFLDKVQSGPQPYHAALILMLIALVATGFSAARSRNWQNAPIEIRRRYALRTSLELGSAFAVVWAVNGFYVAQLTKLQDMMGPWVFRTFQQDGNYVVAAVTTAITVVLCVALMWGIGKLIRRTEAFMVGTTDG